MRNPALLRLVVYPTIYKKLSVCFSYIPCGFLAPFRTNHHLTSPEKDGSSYKWGEMAPI